MFLCEKHFEARSRLTFRKEGKACVECRFILLSVPAAQEVVGKKESFPNTWMNCRESKMSDDRVCHR
jgi:hypothetical protein